MGVWSVNYFDGVYMACAGVCSGGASASGGAGALLGGARKLSGRGLTDSELKERRRYKKNVHVKYQLHTTESVQIITHG